MCFESVHDWNCYLQNLKYSIEKLRTVSFTLIICNEYKTNSQYAVLYRNCTVPCLLHPKKYALSFH